MAVIVEPVVTREKAAALLAEQSEHSCLDYKHPLDPATTRDLVELAKDVAAMQAEPDGGYLLIGADDHGNPVAGLTDSCARHFDDATLRRKLGKYLSEPEIRTARHEFKGILTVLIYVQPSPYGFCIIHAPGEYEEPLGDAEKPRKRTIFRPGEVFVRHGTRSERWNDADRERLIGQVLDRRKEQWRQELSREWSAQLDSVLAATRLERLSLQAVSWQLDADAFEQLITELLRRGDDIALRTLLNSAARDAESLYPNQSEELEQLLDRFTIAAALCIDHERPAWFHRVLGALVRIYELGFLDPQPRAAWLWLEIMTRVYALGALAVRDEVWTAVRLLADRQPQHHSVRRYGGWIRHALTVASRAKLIGEQDGGMLASAHNVVRALGALHPDRSAEHESVLTSLCQFDVYSCLVVMGEQGTTEGRLFNPGFARYYSQRSDPAFERIAIDPAVRAALFDGDDAFLAETMSAMSRYASQEAFRFDGWEGIGSRDARRFIKEHGTDRHQDT